ncbi:hypothetical protein [Sporocytophaga myxococcoides]|uniref:hypothetical protein n=1 Tax=Sporocytophaga myxococcoides TaxID=153721 RepID=UPI0005EF1EED|nr:hypothetical protein [Sporocytophaga myxococcoides]
MILNNWKKFSIISISIIALIAINHRYLAGCAGGDFWEITDSFFAPEVIENKKYHSFFRSMNPMYDGYGGYHKVDYIQQFDTINIEEWKTFLGQQVQDKDLHFLLYSAKLGAIDTLIFYTKKSDFPISKKLKANSITSVADKNKVKEFLYYLGFAKRCTEYCTKVITWYSDDEEPEHDKKKLETLIAGGVKQAKQVKNQFVKERYFFQITRLHFFNSDFGECALYFEDHKDSFIVNPSMKYRSMCYAAGAYRKLDRPADANYLYSVAYDQWDPIKETAFMSFMPTDESDWKGSLALAKNKRQAAALWHLLGIKQDALRAMKMIYNLDPKSDLLELLLARAINIEEEKILPTSIYSLDSTGYKIVASKMDKDLIKFVTDLANVGNTSKPWLWNISAAYLNILEGDTKKGDSFLKTASGQIKSDDQMAMDQIGVIRIISKIQTYTPNDKNEENITRELNWLRNAQTNNERLRSSNAYYWAIRRMAEIYDLWGNKVVSYSLDQSRTSEYLRDNDFLEKMISYLNKAVKTPFDSLVQKTYGHNVNVLYDMQGVNILYKDYNFEEAKKKFTMAGSKYLESDPFTIRLKDCRDCDQAEYDGSYDNLKFINEMIDLEQKVKSNPVNAFDIYFKLANGYYNMTYFGNCRNMYINGTFDVGLMYFYWDSEKDIINNNKNIFDCSKAEEYYIKAMNATTNKELKAKCAFMAAKCEQNAFFISGSLKYNKQFIAGKYFKLLKDQYATTQYYKEIINECGYFKSYLEKK